MRFNKSKFASAALSAMLLFSVLPVPLARAEEGMFMPDKIAGLNLKQKGLKINPEELYNPNGGGLSEAVVKISAGGTGEFVSPDGLILTNHHVAFGALVAASTTEKNYGETGFKADNRAGEIEAKNYSAILTLKSEDVTAQVLNGINSTGEQRAKDLKKRIEDLQKAEKARVGAEVVSQIQTLNSGMYYYMINTMEIKDVRLVYAPPKSIGYYGGDPDNFEWTRHCGDFTFLRAYVAPDGKSAAYSKNNVPYKPKKFMSLSIEGVKENDLTMTIGFPARTVRYRESFSVAFNQDVTAPFLVDYLTAQIAALEMVGRENEDKRVKLQDEVFGLSNGLKATDGGITAMKRGRIVARKRAEEAQFLEWLKKDSARQVKYGEVLPGLETAYADYSKTIQRDSLLNRMFGLDPISVVSAKLEDSKEVNEALKNAIPEIIAGESAVNRELLKFLLRRAAALPSEQKIAAIEKRFGSLQGEARLQAEDEFARTTLENSRYTTEKGLNDLIAMSASDLKKSNDPFVEFVAELKSLMPQVAAAGQKFNAAVTRHRLGYEQGIAEMKNSTPYPDANFSQRFSYGNIKGYMPKESVIYQPFTTLDGVFEKDTGREPFNAPAKLRSLWMQKNITPYHAGGKIPVNFLTTNDIIGGNSGSPVINAEGRQVGIAFDGNYEGLGNDFFFSDALGRTIVVDIRYVLFVTEYFGEAGWILNEMDIKGRAKSADARK